MQYAELLSPREHLQHKREKMQRQLQAALLAKAIAFTLRSISASHNITSNFSQYAHSQLL